MRVVVTSIVDPEVATVFRTVTVPLETALNKALALDAFGGGIDQLTIVAVAVDPNLLENNKWCRSHDKVRSFKHLVTKERIKVFSLALPFNPHEVQRMGDDELRSVVCRSLMNRLDNLEMKLPKGFDYETFSDKLRLLLNIYMRAKFAGLSGLDPGR